MTMTLTESPRVNGGGKELAQRPPRNALSQLADRFAIEPARMLEVLKATVIKTSGGRTPTNEEVAAFVIVANQYGLNPFTREIHAFADPQRGVVPIVGIDGWAHIVNGHEQFNGCEFEEVEAEDGKPIKTTCAMYVKGRERPVKVVERFSECLRNTGPWKQMPFRMLRHKAFMQAARLAFSISGLYDEDEARDIVEGHVITSEPAAVDRLNAKLFPPNEPDPIDAPTNDPEPDAGAGAGSPAGPHAGQQPAAPTPENEPPVDAVAEAMAQQEWPMTLAEAVRQHCDVSTDLANKAVNGFVKLHSAAGEAGDVPQGKRVEAFKAVQAGAAHVSKAGVLRLD